MPRKLVAPTVTRPKDNVHADTIETHPAYAQISASRVSGHKALYGSDFDHQHYMTITVRQSELTRNLSNDWPHARPHPIVSLALSEAQWATFVSTANVGFGVQCTLEYADGKEVPGIDRPTARKQQFQEEFAKRMAEADAAIDRLRAEIAELKVSGKQREALLRTLGTVQSAHRSGVPFIAEQFSEHMEATTEKAKIEITAYAQQQLLRAGLTALQGAAEPVIELPEGRDEE